MPSIRYWTRSTERRSPRSSLLRTPFISWSGARCSASGNPYFRQGLILGLVFASIMILNLRITRFWCRALCPLGALLGAVSRWSILGLEKRRESCTDCNRCEIDCQGGDDPMPGAPWRKAECHLCFNCVGHCPEAGIRFRFFPERTETVEIPELQRRRLVAGLATGPCSSRSCAAHRALPLPADPASSAPPGPWMRTASSRAASGAGNA